MSANRKQSPCAIQQFTSETCVIKSGGDRSEVIDYCAYVMLCVPTKRDHGTSREGQREVSLLRGEVAQRPDAVLDKRRLPDGLSDNLSIP